MVDVHKHCPVCGKPIPLNEATCSDKCQTILINQANKVKKTRLMLYGVFVIFILVWLFLTFFKK
jgi:predicted nucleic acid-binding Zn ribbon protein